MNCHTPDTPDLEITQGNNLNKYKAIVWYTEGKTIDKIAQKLRKSAYIIGNWISKFENHGDVNFTPKRTGRPRKLSEAARALIRQAFDIKSPTILELKKLLQSNGVKASTTTIYRFLLSIGKYKVPKGIPILTSTQKLLRHRHCSYWVHKSFKNIIFTDESKIDLSRKRVRLFKKKGGTCFKKIFAEQD